MSLKQKKISIISSVKNEQDNVEDLVTQIKRILEREEGYMFENILTMLTLNTKLRFR